MASAASSRSRLPPRARLILDLLLVMLFFALDLRDLWFKIQWLGPHDSYSFVAITHHEMQEKPLTLTRNFTFAGQKMQRASGWSSFLQKCETMHPISDGDIATFSRVMGKNCEIGLPENSHKVPELVLSSGVRVDSIAWAACKLLYYHRKPAICHSPIVRLFSERYNIDETPSLLTYKNHNNATLTTLAVESQHNYSAIPGSDAEAELTDLLSVISTSSPISAVVCVEGFIPKGPGRYTSTIFGCGNPSYYKSAFVGLHATAFPLFQQDKARLTADALHVMGMTFVTRENSRSMFTLRNGANGVFELKHKALLNFSSFGALYTVMVTIDMLLIALNVCSVVEIGRLVLGKQQLMSLGENLNRLGAASASKGYKGGLTSSLYRSKPVILLILVAHLISWMVILPNISIWDATELQTGKTHAWLTAARCWVLPLVAFNAIWDLCVLVNEQQALAFTKATYVRPIEVACIAALVAYCKREAVFAITEKKRQYEMQRLSDTHAFRDYTALANTFSGQLDFLQNTTSSVLSIIYAPLIDIVASSVVMIAAFALVRSWYFRAVHNDLLRSQHSSLTIAKRRASKFAVLPDASESPTKPLLSTSIADATSSESRSVQFALSSSPPPSPTRRATALVTSFRDMDGESEPQMRLPLEELVDVPIRARSLVRSTWVMEERVGQQVSLHASLTLEHGIVLENRDFMKSRCGFLDVVHPYLSAHEHVAGEQQQPSLPGKHSRNLKSNVQVPLR